MFHTQLVFSLPYLWNQSLLQESLVPFIGEYYLETKIWVLGILIATWVSLLLVPLSGKSKEIYVYTHICISACVYT